MAKQIKDVLLNLADVQMSDSAVKTLMDFERVIDELGVYVFKNWQHGELVEGPITGKYFVSCTFMWPYKKMPDPSGAKRLTNYECQVDFKKDKLLLPVKIESPEDFEDGTKIARTKAHKIWLVTIKMPKDLMNEIEQGSVEIEGEIYDLETIDQAYEDDLDDGKSEENQNKQAGINATQGM